MAKSRLQFESAFVVIRIERDAKTPESDEAFEAFCYGGLSPIRVFWKEADAEADALRLNQLNGSKGVYYFVAHIRVQSRGDRKEESV